VQDWLNEDRGDTEYGIQDRREEKIESGGETKEKTSLLRPLSGKYLRTISKLMIAH
jgi:hypothetical protein